MRVCILTSEICGAYRNGGVGTHSFRLARFLARQPDYDVTVLYTGDFAEGGLQDHQRQFAQWGIRFRSIKESPVHQRPRQSNDWYTERSQAVFNLLRTDRFDLIHLNDLMGLAFACLQARATGLAFQQTRFFLTLHSPSKWVREGMRLWCYYPTLDARLDFMERYCCEHADRLISPSRYMLDWALAQGWELPKERRVIPYLAMASEGRVAPQRTEATDYSHLIFFGRLETRKGLEVFCDAIDRMLARESRNVPGKITFLGKAWNTAEGNADTYLPTRIARWPEPLRSAVQIKTDLDSADAVNWVVQSGGIAVLPSLQDNLPFAALEMVESHVPFLASSVGGVPELAHESVLFAPTAEGLEIALERRREILSQRIEHPYDPKQVEMPWKALHENLGLVESSTAPSRPPVSLCVFHVDQGDDLGYCLKSLDQNALEGCEVLVVDGGSALAESLASFRRLKDEYSARGWRFFETQGGPAGAKNFAAQQARHETLLFIDGGNLLLPHAVETFAKGLALCGADCLTSHHMVFAGRGFPETGFEPEFLYCPVGPCLGAGLVENIFGESSLCLKRSIFLELGGFKSEPNTAQEDWDFLARLVVSGKKLDVIPAPLILARQTNQKNLTAASRFLSHRRVLKTYETALPGSFAGLLSEYAAAFHIASIRESDGAILRAGENPFTHHQLNTRSFRIYHGMVAFVMNHRWIRPIARLALNLGEKISGQGARA